MAILMADFKSLNVSLKLFIFAKEVKSKKEYLLYVNSVSQLPG